MKQVLFKDGNSLVVDADTVMIPQGEVWLLKRTTDGNKVVRRYPTAIVKDVIEYKGSPLKELAVKLLSACSRTPHGSKKLCQIADVDYDDRVIPVLKKLRQAGKVKFEDGKWLRA